MAGKKTIWDLALEITGDDKGASAALRQVKKNIQDVQAAGKQLSADFKNFTKNAAKLVMGVAGGAAAAGAATLKLAGDFANAGDKVLKTADAIGIGVEAYQELQYAMGKTGVSAETFDTALKKFNLTVRQGAVGDAAVAKQLEAVGLSAAKLAKMSPEHAMMRLSDYMKQLPDDAARTRVAVQLFGKTAGPEMMTALKQGSEAIASLREESKRATFTFSRDQAELSRQFKNTKNGLIGAFENVKFSFIAGSMGPVTDALKTLQETVLSSVPAITKLGEKFGKWLSNMVKKLPAIIVKIKQLGLWVKNTAARVVDFVGGFKNLAKILAALAIAPTLISGLKVIWSLGKFINVTMATIGPILSGLATGGFGALAAAAAPIIGIIAGIAAVVVTVIRNFQELKTYALDCIEQIKSAFGNGADEINIDWEKVKTAALKVWDVVERIIVGGLKNIMALITGAIKILLNVFKELWNYFVIFFEAIKTIITVVVKIFQGDFRGAFQAVQDFLSVFNGCFTNIMDAIKNKFSAVAKLFRSVFANQIETVMSIVDSLADKFGNVFGRIKDFIREFVDFFKKAFVDVSNVINSVGGFFGGIGKKAGDLFGKNRTAAIFGHSDGGIFIHRHIAEIAEKGAEAVVPLDRSPNGFDIWKQAGELGGYTERMNRQMTAGIPAASNPETLPVMQAAAQRISEGNNVIHVNFTQKNTFSGANPNNETVHQISVAGKQAADDLELRVKTILENILRNQHRVSYT